VPFDIEEKGHNNTGEKRAEGGERGERRKGTETGERSQKEVEAPYDGRRKWEVMWGNSS